MCFNHLYYGNTLWNKNQQNYVNLSKKFQNLCKTPIISIICKFRLVTDLIVTQISVKCKPFYKTVFTNLLRIFSWQFFALWIYYFLYLPVWRNGRRTWLKIMRETVWVQVPPPVPFHLYKKSEFILNKSTLFYFSLDKTLFPP